MADAPVHMVATKLVGFVSRALLVEVIERRDGCAWVRTASVFDRGTSIVIDEAQLVDIDTFLAAPLETYR